VACAAIGMATQRELEENLHRAKIFTPLRPQEIQRLEALGKPFAKEWGAHLGTVV